ncbi:lysophospholipase [Paraburkholderia sp. C35]|uniref:lysophospholipase n=1 Tax=Paraburkholderia sp. C35 TaxID=2126993 RepID=UPI001EF54358|nr:lysophospholipase [Paraburkholderia sp. C35]
MSESVLRFEFRSVFRFAFHLVRRLLMLLAALAVLHAPAAMAGEQVVSVPLAQGGSISYLLTQQDGSTPHWVLVMFPGSAGDLELSQQSDGAISMREKNNFLIRSRERFVDAQFATAIVDAPSDQPGGYSDAFRASARSAQDLSQVAASLRSRFPQAKLVLIGTSRGTISTAYVGRSLPDVWDAVVHTSTLSSPARGQATPLIGFDYGSIHARQLFVQHADDGCFLCSYEALRRIAESGQYALITVHGGDVRSKPCDALSHHGFYGRDEVVVTAIKAWISGQPWQDDVG